MCLNLRLLSFNNSEYGGMGCWLVSFHAHLLICVALSQLMQDERGETALFAASDRGHLQTATILLQYGAVVNYADKVRLSMVHRDGLSQNGVLTVYGSLMHVHVDGGLQLEQHDSVFVHL